MMNPQRRSQFQRSSRYSAVRSCNITGVQGPVVQAQHPPPSPSPSPAVPRIEWRVTTLPGKECNTLTGPSCSWDSATAEGGGRPPRVRGAHLAAAGDREIAAILLRGRCRIGEPDSKVGRSSRMRCCCPGSSARLMPLTGWFTRPYDSLGTAGARRSDNTARTSTGRYGSCTRRP